MELYKNSNGNIYRIIEKKGPLVLLENITPGHGFDRFVVAHNLNGDSWQHGNYFNMLQEAMQYFQESITKLEGLHY